MNLSKRKTWLWIIFILTTINTLINIMFTLGWVDIFWGSIGDITVNNGAGYTVTYWFTHISYISSLLVIIWSGWELYCAYSNPYRVTSRVFRYYTILWITITMVCFMPQYPWFYAEDFKHLITGNVPEGWPSADWTRYLYDVLNIVQGTVMHAVVPVICIVFYAKYDGKTEKMNKNDIQTFSIISLVFMVLYFFYCGIATYNGIKEPYPILNWNPLDTDKWPIYLQVLGCLGFAFLYYVINIPVLVYLKNREITQ